MTGRPGRVRALGPLLSILAVLAVLGVTTVVPASAAAGDPRVVAHRGYPGADLTENTLAAFDRAQAHRADAIEFDVQVTGDERLVLMHDETLDRTTTCDGEPSVGELTLAWIRDSCRGENDDAPIPSLGQALAWFAASRVDPVLEMKAGGWAPEVVADLVELIRRHDLAARVSVISFEARLLRRVEDAAPRLVTSLITRSWRDVHAQRSRDSAGNRLDGFSVLPSDLTGARVRRLHAAGYLVEGRTSNDRATWQALWRMRVDGLGTDRLAAYQRWAPS